MAFPGAAWLFFFLSTVKFRRNEGEKDKHFAISISGNRLTNYKNGIILYKLTGFEDGEYATVEELTRLMEQARPTS